MINFVTIPDYTTDIYLTVFSGIVLGAIVALLSGNFKK